MPTHIHTIKVDIYLVANEKALIFLDHDNTVHTLQDTITNILGRGTQPISLNLHLKNPSHLDNRQAYTYTYPSIPTQPHTTSTPRIRPYHASWHPKEFIYTDGSKVTGDPTLTTARVVV